MDKEILREVQKALLVSLMKRAGLIMLFALLSAAALAAPASGAIQGIEEAMSGVNSPEDVASFFSRHFTYTMTLPDRARSPEETIASRTGDCEDFAVLASVMLTRMGIENQVLVVRFSELRMAHAICIWESYDGTYNFISNRELCRSGQRTVEAAIKKFYPDCCGIASLDPRMYVTHGPCSGVSGAKPYAGSELMALPDPRMSTGV